MSQVAWNETGELDLDGIPDGPPPQPEGVYKFEITSVEPSPTKEGKAQINMTVTLTEKVETGETLHKELKFQRVQLSGGAAFRFKALIASTGVHAPASLRLDDVQDYCERLQGAEGYARIRLGKPNKNGRRYSEVDNYLTQAQAEEAAATAAE